MSHYGKQIDQSYKFEPKYEIVKYEYDDDIHDGLKRIRALRDFSDVKRGDLGGWIEKEENLSHTGNCWVYGDAIVRGDAFIRANAGVFGNAKVYGNAKVMGSAEVFDNAKVYGNAKISGNAKVYGRSAVSGNAKVFGNARVYDNTKVFENAKVYENAQLYGNALVYGNKEVLSYTLLTTDTDSMLDPGFYDQWRDVDVEAPSVAPSEAPSPTENSKLDYLLDNPWGFTEEEIEAFTSRSPNKQTEGKPEGARYCFLPYISALSDQGSEALSIVGYLIQTITPETCEADNKLLLKSIIRNIIRIEPNIWDEVIKVRWAAIKSGKYTPENYKEPIDMTLLLDAMSRHYISYLYKEKEDKESGYSHLAHIVANVIIYYVQMVER